MNMMNGTKMGHLVFLSLKKKKNEKEKGPTASFTVKRGCIGKQTGIFPDMQGQKAVGTSCRKGKYSQIQGKNFFPMDMIQHFTRLSQDILEQVGDFRHLRGEGLDPPHLLKASTLWNKGLGKMASRTYFQQKSL